jgi:DNA polymerase-3 subunit gamma/tau
VGSALIVAKHSSAAQLLNSSEWLFDSISLQIVVPGVGKKMLSLVVNPAAEKIIRNELQRLGAPANLMLIPGESTEQSCAQVSDPTEVRNEVPEGEK